MIYEVQLNKAGRFDVTSANQTIFLVSRCYLAPCILNRHPL